MVAIIIQDRKIKNWWCHVPLEEEPTVLRDLHSSPTTTLRSLHCIMGKMGLTWVNLQPMEPDPRVMGTLLEAT
jgi:hypothetical protein